MINLKLFHPYLTKNKEVVIPFDYSIINNIVYCYKISKCSYTRKKNKYIGMIYYYNIDGSYPNNTEYNIIKELTKFSLYYRKEKDLITKSINYIKNNPDIIKQYAIIFID